MKSGTLSKENMNVAYNTATYLKSYKAISLVDFKKLFCKIRGWKAYNYRSGNQLEAYKYYSLGQNYHNTIYFLVNQGIMTKHNINGFILFIATQKCVKAQEKNWFNGKKII